MKPGFWSYVRAAFNARPLGMPVPPNWIFLAAVALLGTLDRGFLMLGVGLELAYLGWLSSNQRFRRTVTATRQSGDGRAWQETVERMLQQLAPADRSRHQTLEGRCRAILSDLDRAASLDAEPGYPVQGSSTAVDSAGTSLSRLSWMYLRLLVTRQAILEALSEKGTDDSGGGGDRALEDRLRGLRRQLEGEALAADLRGSLLGQVEILEQRLAHRREARERLAFLDAELARIEQQVELVREQAVGAPDAEAVSRRIDDIAASLGGTATWIREQQKIYGGVSDLLAEPPPSARPQPQRVAERA